MEYLYVISISLAFLLAIDTKRMLGITSKGYNDDLDNQDQFLKYFMKFFSIFLLFIPVINLILYYCEWNDRKHIYSNYMKE
jgi:hypothetical protein